MNTLKSIATTCANKISLAKVEEKPFKYFVIDHFLPPSLATKCLLSFPEEDDEIWDRQDDDVEKKLRSTYECEFDFPDGLQDAVRILNSPMVLGAMAEALDIPKLIPDPYFTGGGLNMTLKGGMLDVHVDGNYHDATGLNRRVNAILFLNPMWEAKWGGEFGIYDKKGEKLENIILPIANRLVVFDTHDQSFHGSPNPLECPPNESRKSLILYYYTKEPRKHVKWKKPHSALWKKHNVKDKNYNIDREYS